jgi:inner membrane transporter RhtA
MAGIDQLGAAMLVAALAAAPFGLGGALPVFSRPLILLATAGVGVSSSVIPYVTDQLAMARLPRATFALMRFPTRPVCTLHESWAAERHGPKGWIPLT